jgi:hypothetical protein
LALLVPGVAYAGNLALSKSNAYPISVVSAFGSGCTTDSVHVQVNKTTHQIHLAFDDLGAVMHTGTVFARTNCIVSLKVNEGSSSAKGIKLHSDILGRTQLRSGADSVVTLASYWMGDPTTSDTDWPVDNGAFHVTGDAPLADPYDGGRYLQVDISARLKADSLARASSGARIYSADLTVLPG